MRGYFFEAETPGSRAQRLPSVLLAVAFLGAISAVSFALLDYHWDWGAVAKYWRLFLEGWIATLEISALALPLSVFVGVAFALAGRAAFLPLRETARLLVELTRGTPLLVQIYFYWYIFGQQLSRDFRLLSGALILALFSGAYISEIVRSGLESIGESQLETARAIGFTRSQTYRFVILPQAIRQMLPALAGEFANIVKNSSLLSVLGIAEITLAATQVSSFTYAAFESYLPVAAAYLMLTLPISLWTRALERRTHFST